MALFVKVLVEVLIRMCFIHRFDKLFADTFAVHRKSGSIAFIFAVLHLHRSRRRRRTNTLSSGLFLFFILFSLLLFILCFELFYNFVPIFGLFLNDNRFLLFLLLWQSINVLKVINEIHFICNELNSIIFTLLENLYWNTVYNIHKSKSFREYY